MPRFILVCVMAVLMLSLTGCATTIYGVYDDQRLVDTITDDKAKASSIKTSLMSEKFTDGWSTAVYCYYGHAFLVGEVPSQMQDKAVSIAKRHNARSVTTHWFTPKKDGPNNLYLATTLRTALIGTKGLSSTRIDTEINAGRVVLLGVVKDEAERELALRTAREVKNVTEVTDLLMLPLRPGVDSGPGAGAVNTAPSAGAAGGSGSKAGGNSGNTSGGVESRDLP